MENANTTISFIDNTLYVDDREPNSIFTALDRKKMEYIKQRLDVGDFIYNNWVFERKEIMDFYGSIKDGRVFEQVMNMKKNFENCVVIISGSFIKGYATQNYFNENVLTGAMASLISKYKIQITRVEGDGQLIDLINKICIKSNQPFTGSIARIKPKKADILTNMLCCLPSIGYKKAQLISANFNLYELCNASSKDIKAIKGIGEKIASEIKTFFLIE